MTTPEQPTDPTVTRYSEVVAAMKALEGKDDPQSHQRREALIDELLTLDMALQRYRRAMGKPKKS